MSQASQRTQWLAQVQQRWQHSGLLGSGSRPTTQRRWRYSLWGGIVSLIVGGVLVKSPYVTNATIPDVLPLEPVNQPQAVAAARVGQKDEQRQQIRPENYDLSQFPLTDANAKHWRHLLWTTAVVEPREEFVADGLQQILTLMLRPNLVGQQRRTVELATKTATQLYLSDPTFYQGLGQQFLQTVQQSPDPEWVAVSLSALAHSGLDDATLRSLVARVKLRFPGWQQHLHLMTTLRDLEESRVIATPPLADLLKWQIAPKQLHLYVLCQRDRYVLCRAVLKDRQGQFVRHSNGTLWSIPLLLKSLHQLNWNFERGQTPQGIYRIEGVRPQPDDEYFRAYGHFSLVNLFLPFEPGAKQFLPGQPGEFKGSLAEYLNLLPPSWRRHWGMQQSFWAGKIGRNYFRIHGTGEAPDFFPGKVRYGDSFSWNPTIGCLSALELYNEQGQLIQADMPKLLKALEIVGGKAFTGYLIVAELPNTKRQPITLAAIEETLAIAQASPKPPTN